MSAVLPPLIHAVRIAAAHLEDAEFERDSLALACGEAIRRALARGRAVGQISQAADRAEAEVFRLAEAPSGSVGAVLGASIVTGGAHREPDAAL